MPDRRNVKRKRGRYSFLLTFFVIIALIFAFFLTSGLFFKIKEVRVEGTSVYSAQDIINLSGFTYGDNIFLINKITAARSILANLPYVRGVRIKRELPGTVVVIITEAVPAAMIENLGSYWLFDTQGKLLEAVAIPLAPKYPVVKGLTLLAPVAGGETYFNEDDMSKLEPLLDILKEMLSSGVWEDVGEIDMSRLSNIRFSYLGKYTVELGTPELIEKKFQIMLSAMEKIGQHGSGTLYLSPVAEDKPARFVPGDGS